MSAQDVPHPSALFPLEDVMDPYPQPTPSKEGTLDPRYGTNADQNAAQTRARPQSYSAVTLYGDPLLAVPPAKDSHPRLSRHGVEQLVARHLMETSHWLVKKQEFDELVNQALQHLETHPHDITGLYFRVLAKFRSAATQLSSNAEPEDIVVDLLERYYLSGDAARPLRLPQDDQRRAQLLGFDVAHLGYYFEPRLIQGGPMVFQRAFGGQGAFDGPRSYSGTGAQSLYSRYIEQ